MRPAERPDKLRGWLPLLIGGGIVAIVLVVIATVRVVGVSDIADYDAARAASTSDFRDFWFTARHFRETGQITADFGVHNYLPFFTIFMLPWSYLPLPAAAGAFVGLSLLLTGLCVVMVEMLLNQQLGRWPRRATLAALGLIIAYVATSSVLGTVNLLLLFLIIATWVLFEQQREWEAGIPLGLAVLIKLLPAVLIVFFLVKRRWRVAATAVAVSLIGTIVFPLTTLGYQETAHRYEAFAEGALVEHSARSTILSVEPRKGHYSNVSLPIVLRRLLTPTDAAPGHELFVNIADWPRVVVFWVYALALIAIVGATLAVSSTGPPKWPPSETAPINAIRAQFATWCCLMLIAAPLVWTHYFVLAYWPVALLADRAQRTETTRTLEHKLCLAALLAWLAAVVLLASPAARAVGAPLLATLIAWGALLRLALWREPPTRELKVVKPPEP